MSTTSLKLPQDIKQLAAEAAEQQGISPHAFMVDAIRVAAINAEKYRQFLADATDAMEEMYASGKGYVAEDVHTYLRARAQGLPAKRPEATSWQK